MSASSRLLPPIQLSGGLSPIDRFEQVVSLLPAEPAILDGSERWEYDRLNRAANRIAHHLLELRGSGSEAVALLFPQGAHLLAGLLGVLKAGKFYVPLDPFFPASRNATILTDSGAALLLTDRDHLSMAVALAGESVTVLEYESCIRSDAEGDPGLVIAPQAPALLIHTSGSTGAPKGVLHDRQTLLHNAARQNDLMEITPADRFSMLYSSSVMGLVRDCFNALLHGASLYPFDLRTQGLARLVEYYESQQLTVLHTIPSVFRQLQELLAGRQRLGSLRLLVLGGEAVLRADFEQFRRCFSGKCRLFTGLGMTETGTVLQSLLSVNDRIDDHLVPLGKPVRDVDVLLLDETGSPVSPGQVGEIAVCSRYIALGYWHGPAKGAQPFDPLPGQPQLRLFRTGDLGERRPDGTLVHHGRRDHQIKLRGHRIELLEVEAVLLETGQVLEAVVSGHEIRPGDKRLVAYIVPHPQNWQGSKALRSLLAKTLPEAMIPQLFVELERLPLTPNGKVDRARLPAPVFGSQAVALQPPRNDVESALLELWKELLPAGQPGIDESFFDLGGDSLLASVLLMEIDRRFGRIFPLSLLLEKNTIRQLAEVLQDPGSGASRGLVAVKPDGDRPPLFLIPGGYGDVLYLRHLARHLPPEQPLYGIQAESLEGERVYMPEIGTIAASYLEDVVGVQPQGPYLLGGHSFGGYIAIEMGRQLIQRGERVALLAMLDTYPPGKRRQAALPQRIRIHLDNLRPMNAKQRWQYLQARFDQLSLRLDRRRIASGVRLADLPPLQKAVTYSRLARYTYDPGPYPGELVLFQATERPWYMHWDPMENWPKYVSGQLRVHSVPGRHESILFEPSVRDLAAALEGELQRALAGQK